MKRTRLQDRYPNREGIYTDLRKLGRSELEVQIQYLLRSAQQLHEHAKALMDYRDQMVEQSRQGR
ncbi:hypothetical protein [Lysobacter sp. Hz 25]|uniref:hypothetical protein n=1 Tax=Lysobacter sp. Hz 25 TaxID=3383698 RepID=UPI0038D4FBA0